MRLPALAVTLLLIGCTTAPVQPAVEKFSKAVSVTSGAVERRYASGGFAEKLQNEYDQQVVAQRAFIELEDCTGPIALSVPLDDPGLADFARHCRYQPSTIDARGDIAPAEIMLQDGLPGITADNARRLSAQLGAYAEALGNLAKTKKPAELGRNFGAATAAVLNLVDQTTEMAGGDGLTRTERAVADAGTGLASALVTEYFETRRYRLLKTLIKRADPTVQLSARALAGWFRAAGSAEITAAYDALEDAKANQQRAIAALNKGRGSEQAAVAATRDVRVAYDKVAELETSAPWRVPFAIAEAHTAMLDSFAAPGDLEALARANDRIDGLASKAVAFVEAVEAAKGGSGK